MADHSLMAQLKSQLQIDRNIAEDETINAMPDSGNVDAFAKQIVSAAEPVNMSLKAVGRFGAENADGVVSVLSEDEDEFGGNDNNRRVAERIARERENAASVGETRQSRQARARAKAQAEGDASVIGEQREMDAELNENNARVDLEQTMKVDAATRAVIDGSPGDQAAASVPPEVSSPVAERPQAAQEPSKPQAARPGAGEKWKPAKG